MQSSACIAPNFVTSGNGEARANLKNIYICLPYGYIDLIKYIYIYSVFDNFQTTLQAGTPHMQHAGAKRRY